jgi:sarcosine dehydrogenase
VLFTKIGKAHLGLVNGVIEGGAGDHDAAWIGDHIAAGFDAELIDVTERFGTLSLMGPRSRDILRILSREDLSSAAFPFGHVRTLLLAGHEVRALRVTYVGELGWELHMPIAVLGDVFDSLMHAGAPHGLAPVGYRALESLRLEKFYRAWGSDITPNDNPFEAGLGWTVKLKSSVHFLGREAMEKQANSRLGKKLACFVCDDPDIVLLGRETILRDGEQVGYLTSGGFGYTLGRPIGLGYVRKAEGLDDDFLRAGHYELVVAQECVPCKISLEPLYDPANARVRA